MLNIEYRLKLGQDEFIIRGDYKNEKEFFNSMSFFSSLPKTAPNGATDLKLVVRETKKGKYYSLVSEQEKMEFQLGQHKEGDTLYAKEWVPLYQAEQEQGGQVATGQGQAFAPVTVGMAPVQAQPAQVQQQVVQQPQQQQYVPQQVVIPQVQQVMPQPQVIQQPVQQQVVTPTPQAAPVQQAQPAAVNPNVSAVAANVLSRFNIQPK